MAPQPSLKCPDLAKSQARNNVDAIQTDWAWTTMVQYLTNGGDWVAMATKVQDAQNKAFEDTFQNRSSRRLESLSGLFC